MGKSGERHREEGDVIERAATGANLAVGREAYLDDADTYREKVEARQRGKKRRGEQKGDRTRPYEDRDV